MKKNYYVSGSFLFLWLLLALLPACNKAKTMADLSERLSTQSPALSDSPAVAEPEFVSLDSLSAWGEENPQDTLSTPQADTLTLSAVGDVMFGTNFPDTSEMPPNNGADLLKPFAAYLGKADINFANVEGTFLNSGGTPKGSGKQVYCFRQPLVMAENFKTFGFNLLSVANNHIADFGSRGIQSTDSTLSAMKFHYAGLAQKPATRFKIRNFKIGFAAFAPHNGSADMNNISAAEEIVRKLKKENDVVIVSFHGGAEGAAAQHVPRKKEIFYKQNRGDVYEFSHRMIDAGADVILGHGPHVVRAMELYKDRIIAYSLGNFCTYGMFNLKGPNSNAPLLMLSLDQNGKFLHGKIISGKQYVPGGPVLDEREKNAFHKIKELTAQDFPETSLKFENGLVLRK